MKRNLYLNVQRKEEALDNFLNQFKNYDFKTITIKTTESLHFMTAKAIYASYNSPSYNSCAMDGIAVISSHTTDASENHPILLKYEEDYRDVDTGDLLKHPYDAVIMAEDLIECEEGYKIIAPTHPFSHVRAVGEDLVTHEMVLPSFHTITPIDVSVLLSAGIHEVEVLRPLTVGIIPTGDEMIRYDEELVDGKIIETNSYMFENLVIEQGAKAHRYPIIKDDLETIKNILYESSINDDVIIINAGSSAGRDDYTVHAIKAIGEVYTHGVAIKPGKPVILGKINGKPVIGLPGYPVSAYMTFHEFVVPLLQMLMHKPKTSHSLIKATLTKTLMSSLKYEEYVRVKLGIVNGHMIATPLKRGAGASMSLVQADGFCIIPQDSEGILAHEEVNVRLMKELQDIQETLVVIGSHDLILDVLNDLLIENQESVRLSSTHVGSLSGLLALKNQEAHLAPSHLLNEKDGSYNEHITKDMFPDDKMVIIKGVKRKQGFIVKKGNPLGIQTIEDLKNHRFVNRQRGAGTRVLLDYCLKTRGIDSKEITGYEHVVTTHMAVAIAVDKDNADVGMGVYSAAKALDLDFIEMAHEDYDFVTYEKYLELPAMQKFIDILKNPVFHKKLDELGGYSYENIGEIIKV